MTQTTERYIRLTLTADGAWEQSAALVSWRTEQRVTAMLGRLAWVVNSAESAKKQRHR